MRLLALLLAVLAGRFAPPPLGLVLPTAPAVVLPNTLAIPSSILFAAVIVGVFDCSHAFSSVAVVPPFPVRFCPSPLVPTVCEFHLPSCSPWCETRHGVSIRRIRKKMMTVMYH